MTGKSTSSKSSTSTSNRKAAWVTFDNTGKPNHMIVQVDDKKDEVTLSRADFEALAARSGLSETTSMPDDEEPFDPERVVRPLPVGNQRLVGEPNRRDGEPNPADAVTDDTTESVEGDDPKAVTDAEGK